MRARTRLALDAALLVAFIAAYRPAWTGLTVHQWLSIVIIAPLLVHGVLNWEWTVRVARTFFERLLHMSRLNLVIDAALFVSAVVVMVSGVMVAPALLGVHAAQPPVWHAVHAWSANATITMLAVHGVAHWRWLYKTAVRLAAPPTPRVRGRVAAPAGGRAASLARETQMSARTAAAAQRTSHVGRRAAQAAAERATAFRAISVVGVTGLVGLTVFAGVSMASPKAAGAAHATTKVAETGGTVCPATGCTASKCHGQYGKSAKEFYAPAKAKPKMRRKTASASSSRRVALATFKPLVVEQKKTATPAVGIAPKRVAVASAARPKPKPAKVVRVAASKPKVHKQTCPRTGCTASSCHGAHGVSAHTWYKSH